MHKCKCKGINIPSSAVNHCDQMIETMSWTQKTNPSICEWIIQTGFVNQITLIQKIIWK